MVQNRNQTKVCYRFFKPSGSFSCMATFFKFHKFRGSFSNFIVNNTDFNNKNGNIRFNSSIWVLYWKTLHSTLKVISYCLNKHFLKEKKNMCVNWPLQILQFLWNTVTVFEDCKKGHHPPKYRSTPCPNKQTEADDPIPAGDV
jgi:hypothetical protein